MAELGCICVRPRVDIRDEGGMMWKCGWPRGQVGIELRLGLEVRLWFGMCLNGVRTPVREEEGTNDDVKGCEKYQWKMWRKLLNAGKMKNLSTMSN